MLPGSRSWRDTRFVALDVETTGLDLAHDEVISFAGIPIESGRIIAARELKRRIWIADRGGLL